MYILDFFDWFGSIEELEKLDKTVKKNLEGSGVEYLGRFAPYNRNYHWTYFFKAKDLITWENARLHIDAGYKRDYKVHTHEIMEFYG